MLGVKFFRPTAVLMITERGTVTSHFAHAPAYNHILHTSINSPLNFTFIRCFHKLFLVILIAYSIYIERITKVIEKKYCLEI